MSDRSLDNLVRDSEHILALRKRVAELEAQLTQLTAPDAIDDFIARQRSMTDEECAGLNAFVAEKLNQ